MTKELDLMIPNEIKNGLGTKILGCEVISFIQTSSTNDVAMELANKGAREGLLIVAENQIKGRGRRERSWLCPMGTGILASLILRPQIEIKKADILTLLTAVSVAKAIHNLTNLHAFIKWPNDIIINNKKVSGILAEMRSDSNKIDFVIIGIGINVNIHKSQMPKEIEEIATSLSIELGNDVSRIALLQEVLRLLEDRYLRLKDGNFEEFIDEWRSLLNTIGQNVEVNLHGKVFSGHVLDVDENGALIVELSNGSIQRVFNVDDESSHISIVRRS